MLHQQTGRRGNSNLVAGGCQRFTIRIRLEHRNRVRLLMTNQQIAATLIKQEGAGFITISGSLDLIRQSRRATGGAVWRSPMGTC